MNKFLTFLVFSSFMIGIFSCGGNDTKPGKSTDKDTLYGEILDIAINQQIEELDPVKIVDGYSIQISSQLFECLVKFNSKDLSIEPLLAKSWSVDEVGLTYTFELKKGVFFQDNECFEGGRGREMKAKDVAYTINRICNFDRVNYAYYLLKNKLAGAKECFESSSVNEVSGVKIIDDYTVSFTLTKPSSNFLQTLATPSLAIVPEEATANNTFNYVGTGPFIFGKKSKTDSKITLERNTNYHQTDENGNRLPYLDAVSFHFVPKSQDRLKQFEDKTLDIIVDLPSQSIKDVVEKQIADFESKPPKFILGRYPELVTTYLEFNTQSEPFNNPKIRKAIAMAIDKVNLVNEVLNGEAYGPAMNGIVPPSIKNYDYSSIVGIEYDVEKAKKLLSEAGFKDGKGFPHPKLLIGDNEGQMLKVAMEIQKQLALKLNINAEIISMTFAEKMALKTLPDAGMMISAWLADFPTPDNFLNIGYGGYVLDNNEQSSFPNVSRFKNKDFDSFYEKAISTTDVAIQTEMCLKAEQILINEVPVFPLWYNENYRLFQSNIIDYQPNVMFLHDLTKVRIVELKPTTADTK